jgi:hypothetical protein
MNRIYQVGPILGCIVFAASVAAAVTGPQPHSIIVCHSPVATREIRTYHTGNGGCRVDYLKDATTRTLWSASSDRGYCDSRVNALAATLARGNFSCDATGAASLDASPTTSGRDPPAASTDKSDLTQTQIGAANSWLQRRVDTLRKNQPVRSGPEAKQYSSKPDFLAASDLDADGKTDLVLGWSWGSFRCDGAYLTVLINDATDAQPTYRPAEVTLPGNCGAKGWASSVKDVKARRVFIDLQQRYPGANNVQHISATIRHDGTFTFFDPAGKAGTLVVIEKALPMKSE